VLQIAGAPSVMLGQHLIRFAARACLRHLDRRWLLPMLSENARVGINTQWKLTTTLCNLHTAIRALNLIFAMLTEINTRRVDSGALERARQLVTADRREHFPSTTIQSAPSWLP
jgi:hypothetical protein